MYTQNFGLDSSVRESLLRICGEEARAVIVCVGYFSEHASFVVCLSCCTVCLKLFRPEFISGAGPK